MVYIVSEYFLQIYSFVDMSVIMSLKAQFLLWLISSFFPPQGRKWKWGVLRSLRGGGYIVIIILLVLFILVETDSNQNPKWWAKEIQGGMGEQKPHSRNKPWIATAVHFSSKYKVSSVFIKLNFQ